MKLNIVLVGVGVELRISVIKIGWLLVGSYW